MTRNKESNATRVHELSPAEIRTISGGIAWLTVALVVGGYIIANWPDIKDGASSGWNS